MTSPDEDPPTPGRGTLRELVADVPFWSGLDAELHAEIAAAAHVVRVRAGEVLFEKDQAGDALYGVVSGRLEVVGPSGRAISAPRFRAEVTGQSAQVIAEALGVRRDHPIAVLVVPCAPDLSSPMTSEKLGPFLSLFPVTGDAEALELCGSLIDKMGTGHTAIAHTRDQTRATRFAEAMPASRLLFNSPGSQGVCGLTTGLTPAFTLGCGTFGGNSTTDNVTWRNLVNVKRLATLQPPPDDLAIS